jgi:hypothetical protein
LNQARSYILIASLLVSVATIFAGCSSGQKEREEQRNRLSASSGMYCEFINGDEFQDIDIELNMSMAKRCDSSKPYTLTQYKNSSDVNGLLYCCSIVRKEVKHAEQPDFGANAEKKNVPPAIAKPDPNAKKATPSVVPPPVETKKPVPTAPVPMKNAAPAAAVAPTAAPSPAPAPAAAASTPAATASAPPASASSPAPAKPAAPPKPAPAKPAPKGPTDSILDEGDDLL